MRTGYVIGSDKKTVKIAKQLNDKINQLLTVGDFEEAEKMIDAALSSPNQPFRAEFLHQVEICVF
jgi:hypothetical protein